MIRLLLILLVAAGLGQFSHGLYGATLYSALMLVLDRYSVRKSAERRDLRID